jgi:glycosyltransferase involved in cell wall biosynthesis
MNHEVTVVSPVPFVPPGIPKENPWYQYKNVKKQYINEGIKIYHPRFISIPKRYFFFLRGELMYFTALNFYQKLLKSEAFDIIHCHVALPDGVVGSYISRHYKIPYGITIHGADIYESVTENTRNYKKIKKVIENADFIGVVSRKLYHLMLEKKIMPPSKKTKIIYNGLNYSKQNIEIEFKNKESIKLLSVCHLIRRKGIDIVLKSFKMLKNKYDNIELFVIGEGQDAKRLKKMNQELGLTNNVFFLGEKSNTEVFSYMKKCDIFVLPSWDESFGIVFTEAMSVGMITIGSYNEGISEIIQDGINGFLVEPKNVMNLADKLEYVIKNLSNMTSIKSAAIKSVKSVFSWEKNANEYEQLYQNTKKLY